MHENIINNLIENRLKIVFIDGDELTITEENIASESMTLKQSVCEESNLKFGGCIASEFCIDLLDTQDRSFSSNLVGKWISVRLAQSYCSDGRIYPNKSICPMKSLYPGNSIKNREWYIFDGFIESVKTDHKDNNIKHIVAYDVMAKLHSIDFTERFMSFLNYPPSDTVYKSTRNLIAYMHYKIKDTLGEYFFDYNSINYFLNEITAGNKNVGDFIINNSDWNYNDEKISVGTILKYVCEMICVFGVIKPNGHKGIFKMIELGNNCEEYYFYNEFFSENYKSGNYTMFRISVSGSDRSNKYFDFEPSDIPDDVEKVYIPSDNIIAWQETDGSGSLHNDTRIADLLNSNVALRLYDNKFTPFEGVFDGRPWVNVGDKIKVIINRTDIEGNYIYDMDGNIQTEEITSYVLNRTLSGIKALEDNIEAKGE